MINVLVTGSNGQVGSELQAVSKEYNYNFFFTDRNSLDITDRLAIENFTKENSINFIINAAAYTAVDKAEEDGKNADKVNHLATKYLAQIAKDKNIKLIHISTDYVFDGKNFKPYTEDDTTNPNGVYGATKLLGEKALQEINPSNSIIIRTSWVYSSFGANFVKTMLRLGKERDELGVIYDQVGTPTYARDLAKTILEILPKIQNSKLSIYNYSNEGVISWYDFSKEIFKIAKINCKLNPITTEQYPTPARRPKNTLMNKNKIIEIFNVNIISWKDSLAIHLRV